MSDSERPAGEEDVDQAVEGLIRLAGARPVPSPQRAARVRAHVHQAWRSGVRRRRWRSVLALAAAGLAVIGVVLVARSGGPVRSVATASPPPVVVAHLEMTAGGVEREG